MIGLDMILGAGLRILDKFIPDPEARARAESELRATLMAQDAAQLQVNAAEAAHRSLFVAGWRPFLGWVFGIAFAFQLAFYPLAAWVAAMFFAVALPEPPKLDPIMSEAVLAMLGVAGLRTFEKLKGVAR